MSERPLPPVQEAAFRGMVSNERVTVPVGYVSLAQNFYLDDGVYVPRDGLIALGQPAEARVQGIVNFVELDGTPHLLVFSDADMHEYDWSAGTWDTTDLGTAGVTVDPSEDLEFVQSRGRLVVTDGVNTPWMLTPDGVGGWTFTVLSNAPIGDGVELYYAKAFFYDLPAEENEFEWSDEADPANGYEANDQVWEFGQRDTGRIVAMRALNELMVILKQDSASMLMGAVDEDFRTNAVREGLSETEGCIGRRAAIVYEGDVYVLSQEGPRVAIGGQRWQPLDLVNPGDAEIDVLEDIWSGMNRSEWVNALSFIDTKRGHIGWLVPRGSSTDLNYALVFAVREGAWQIFTWGGDFDFTAVADVEDINGEEYVLFGDEDGTVYQYGSGATSDAGTAIEYVLRSRPYGRSTPSVLKRLVEVHMRLNLTTDVTAQIRPVQDGVVGQGLVFGLSGTTGRRLFRAGMNATGYHPGWELYLNTAGQAISVESVTTFLTAAGMYGQL